MLFLVTHYHTRQTCPSGDSKLVKKSFGKIVSPEHIRETEVELIGGYPDAPAHTVYFIIKADSIEKVESFLIPLLELGSAEITPVTDLVEDVAQATFSPISSGIEGHSRTAIHH